MVVDNQEEGEGGTGCYRGQQMFMFIFIFICIRPPLYLLDLSNGGTGCNRGQQTEVSQKTKQDQGKPVIIQDDDDRQSITRRCYRI